jgi:hypothetical protein
LPQVEIPVGLSLPVRAILLPQREFSIFCGFGSAMQIEASRTAAQE